MLNKNLPKADSVDIMFLLEGTYPYVPGGVSTWVAQMLAAYPEYTFGAVFLGSHPEEYKKIHYTFPENFIHLETKFLFSSKELPNVKLQKTSSSACKTVKEMHDWFRMKHTEEVHPDVFDVNFCLNPKKGVSFSQFLYSKESWDYIKKTYEDHSLEPSFIEYFWTIRNMHLPIWHIANIVHGLPKAKVFHAVSTGYAGYLGALAAKAQNSPLILSEHGIYTKERRIDLLKSHLAHQEFTSVGAGDVEYNYLQKLLVRFFSNIGLLCYQVAEPIVSLFEFAKQQQIADGAPAEKTRVIPNGISVEEFKKARRSPAASIPPVLCLLGRVVSIKDIKTFIRMMRTVVNAMPEAEGWIVGPLDEDKEYVVECLHLSESLGLSKNVKFLGLQNSKEILKKVGLLVLSSISEGMPLVVLEGFAAGIPSVTTDVGSCRALIFGANPDDEALGTAGDVVSLANPKLLAEASLALLQNPERWYKAQATAIARVEKYYNKQKMFNAYKTIYEQALEKNKEKV